jgi:O-antigen/teichoic acid export membrane protein
LGIIQRQTIKGTFYSYLGVVIGFVSLAILSPKVFTAEEIGLTQVLIATSAILAQIGGLGFSNVTNRLFPYFRDRASGHHGFLSLSLLITIAGFLITAVLIVIYLPNFEEVNKGKSALLSDYAFYIPVLLGTTMLFTLLDNFCKVLFNAVIGTFMKEFLQRILNLGLILLFFFNVIDFNEYILYFVLSQAVPAILIVIYLIREGEFRLTGFRDFIDRALLKEISKLCLFGIVAGLSGIAITNIDKYMVNSIEGLGDAGIYSIAVYFATIILIPTRSLGKISVPVIAEAWKKDDIPAINYIYSRSSINQYLMGLLIIVGIFGNLGNIFKFLPPEYISGKWVIIIFSIANLINASTGVSQYILGTSSLYRYQTYLMLLLIIMVIITNAVMIPVWGMTGAAIASLISMSVFTFLTVFILWKNFRLWPFSIIHFKATIVAIIIFIISAFIPGMSLYIDVVVRSMIITILFTAAILFLNLSDEGSDMFRKIIGPFRRD